MTFSQIAKELGMTREEVELIYQRGMRKLTHPRNKAALFKLIESVYDCNAQQYIKKGSWRIKGDRQC